MADRLTGKVSTGNGNPTIEPPGGTGSMSPEICAEDRNHWAYLRGIGRRVVGPIPIQGCGVMRTDHEDAGMGGRQSGIRAICGRAVIDRANRDLLAGL
ncbi:MAG: hypothetical protein ABSF64_14990 [Bryobacteraceae bacterium]|jgi:hypothetical protein